MGAGGGMGAKCMESPCFIGVGRGPEGSTCLENIFWAGAEHARSTPREPERVALMVAEAFLILPAYPPAKQPEGAARRGALLHAPQKRAAFRREGCEATPKARASARENAEIYGIKQKLVSPRTLPTEECGRLYGSSPTPWRSGKVERWKSGKVRAKRVDRAWG